ncbi:MAG: ModD protein [Aeromonadaceae bacterium]
MQSVLSDEQLVALLQQDVPYGDLTTDLLLDPRQRVTMLFSARQAMTLCAVEEMARLCTIRGASAQVLADSGQQVAAGQAFLRVVGPCAEVFALWKACQIVLEWASGIASATHDLVMAAAPVPVVCTRKQTPFTKALSVKAVRAGGGAIHRLGLSESILLFAEHRQFLTVEPEAILQLLQQRAPEQRRVVEVHDLADAQRWARAGAEVLQMDKFTPEQVRECADYCHQHALPVVLAAAGGVTLANARDYVAAGAKLLVTSAPYHAKPMDVKVTFSAV